MVRALQVTNSTPHASGVRASVLHVRSCVGNRLFASTQLAVMPYPSHKNAVQNPTIANIESILLSVSLHAGGSRSNIEWRPVLVGIYPVSNTHKASAGCTTRWVAAYYSCERIAFEISRKRVANRSAFRSHSGSLSKY